MNDRTKVLVIEDDGDIADIVRFALEQEGCEVHLARDGEAGLSMAASLKPHVILLDISMPRMDGLSALRELRRKSGRSDLRIIMMTARARATDISYAVSQGADDYLVKPFDLQALTRKVVRHSGPSPHGSGTSTLRL